MFGVVRADRRFVDDRAYRRDRLGIGAGAFSGGALGLMLSNIIGWDSSTAVALTALGGAAAGALIGRAFTARINLDEWDPSTAKRPHVGAHTPDDDISGPRDYRRSNR